MAYSIVLDVMAETSEVGELVTKAREELVEIYGTGKSKYVSDVYSQAVDVIRQIRSETPGGKLSNEYIYLSSTAIGAEIIRLQIVNSGISWRIKYLGKNVYINRITPAERRSGLGGAGASGSW